MATKFADLAKQTKSTLSVIHRKLVVVFVAQVA